MRSIMRTREGVAAEGGGAVMKNEEKGEDMYWVIPPRTKLFLSSSLFFNIRINIFYLFVFFERLGRGHSPEDSNPSEVPLPVA